MLLKSLQVFLKSYKNADITISCILAYFCRKMKNFHPKVASMPRKVFFLLHISHFVAFRQLEGVFKRFQKVLMSAHLHFG